MITLDQVQRDMIDKALIMLPASFDSPEARVMLLATGRQESRFNYRYQQVKGQPYVKGPARGFWQFEEGGGVNGVMTHPATSKLARDLCEQRGVEWNSRVIHHMLEDDDVLACGFARLLLYSDPHKLPALNAEPEEAWQYYVRNWRPGKPHRETWDAFHAEAVHEVCA